jgi:hypothetical protein
MSENLLSMLKRTVIDGAVCTASKLEEGARIGKLKLDIIAEENRLEHKYAKLGKQLFTAIQGESVDSLSANPEVVEQVGAISDSHQKIQDIKEKLKAVQANIGKAC